MYTPEELKHRFEADTVGRALTLVGERWSLLILRECLFGVRRYGEFARNLSIPRPTLSARLKTLVEAGLLVRVPYDPDRHEYRLTQMGRELFPAIVTLMRWGDRYLADPDGPPILFRHMGCGEISESYVACRNCGGEIEYHTVTPEPGPSFRQNSN